MERHCCSTHDQDNGSSNSLRHLLDQVNDYLFAPTPLVNTPPLTDDGLLEWLAQIDQSDGNSDGRFVPANDLDTTGGGSSTSFRDAPTKGSVKSPLSPVKEKKKTRRERDARSSYERKRRARINGRIEILKKLVPTSRQSDDTANLLDKTIDHIKQLHEMRKIMSHTFSSSKAVPANGEVQWGVSFAFQPMAFVSTPMQSIMQMMDIERSSSSNSYDLPFRTYQTSTHPFFYGY